MQIEYLPKASLRENVEQGTECNDLMRHAESMTSNNEFRSFVTQGNRLGINRGAGRSGKRRLNNELSEAFSGAIASNIEYRITN